MFCVHFPTEMARQGSVKADLFLPIYLPFAKTDQTNAL